MKKNIFIMALMLLGGLFSGTVKAQQTATLVADQNPRYAESMAKYLRSADTLNSLHGTTIQNTYKAYDWYEAKLERRRQNREWRHQERMNGYYDYSPSWGLYGGYSYSPFLNYGWGNRWGGYYGGRWGGRTSIGVGFGW
ncbi:hypothetical protein MTO98_09140 [Mucilaginibacter sp. SMC90]|uniref:hypothetical protein n=1 Tax=Mucilaginibacter sp. SMC90 TaxID=2929803 RepID=UPI001FB3D69A|nr:hypothetical protein [Mucilaginibacter sp. SMC90]UOE51241.1 hypothetical protein MTO98_09140 [Mucilaginibacter sp. SMC90]